MPNNLFKTPVSFHIFNRPHSTRSVFKQIKSIMPSKLFITADGPRDDVITDQENCSEARSIVNEIDWECEIFTNFSKTNRGSYVSTSKGISWVFEHVERAIILEDDCIPHHSFFKFCEELLDYYENDKRIALISGTNFLFNKYKPKQSYYFSRYTHLWGWATWKRTWEEIDFSMSNWPEFRDMKGLELSFKKQHELHYWQQIMQQMYEGVKGPHWDYLLLLSLFMNNSLTIRPSVNLINNSGYGVDSTHFAKKSAFHDVKTININFPLNHPLFICKDIKADEITELLEFSGGLNTFLAQKIKNYIPQNVLSLLKIIRRQYRNEN